MGIKGIYKEIGPGNRISVTKLAVQTLEKKGRPLRIAIDISIWQFQVQAAKGGSNPAVRTLFYRLLRLLSSSIQPIFVFDGPNKPVFKRNKRSGRGDGVATAMAKRMIRLFGFPAHDAPGEAEAECALLQRHGIVDAVLSEDVDTIMFGCTQTLRNWSAEGSSKGSKTPTHVSMYDTEELLNGASGLDREGMVLVALMSGGDYLPEGIPGAGVKLACEAARAGFGKALCQLKRSETSELASWKERLTYELRHNESGFFRTKHKALVIPDEFPNIEILRYYTHPVVSPPQTLERLRQQTWDKGIDVEGLREFVYETFDWTYRIGAIKFIRVLAPALLVRKLTQCIAEQVGDPGSRGAVEEGAPNLIDAIKSRRTHASTDATPELRVSFIPASIVGYDFEAEPDEVIEFGRDGLALNSDNEMDDLVEELGDADSAVKSTTKKTFNPTDTDLLWIPETIMRAALPSIVEKWEGSQRAKSVAQSQPKTSKRKTKTNDAGTPAGGLDTFLKVTKNNVPPTNKASRRLPADAQPTPARVHTPTEVVPTVAPKLNAPQILGPFSPSSSSNALKSRSAGPSKPPTPKTSVSRGRRQPANVPKADINVNPWTIASSQGSPRAVTTARTTATSKPTAFTTKASEPIFISSSPPSTPPKAVSAPVRRNKGGSIQGSLDPFTPEPMSPAKRRLMAPSSPLAGRDRFVSGHETARRDPIPAPFEKPQRRPAKPRTESRPANTSPHPLPGRRRELKGAQKVVAETLLLSLDSEDSDNEVDDEDDDDDDNSDSELPPLSNLIRQIPKGNKPSSESLPAQFISRSAAERDLPDEQDPAAATTTASRTTKLYIPSTSEPGFYREVDVSVDEADALAAQYAAAAGSGGSRSRNGGRRREAARVWRRSDVSCVDLTGED